MTKRIILDLCGGTGAWSAPYADAGYDVRVVTLPDNDVLTFKPPRNVHGVLAAPPCDQFSFVLNEKIKRKTASAMRVVNACLRIVEECKPKWWALENPIGHLVDFIGRPRFIFQPWQFGDPWTKRTGIWGNFVEPPVLYTDWNDVPKLPLYVRPGREKPNMVWLHKSSQALIPSFARFRVETDAAFRAITPQGFAYAFFEANR